jgi:PQQ-dependent catabolism-associated beta-propeller protein
VTRTLDTGPDPEALALSPSGGLIYVSNANDSMVTVLEKAIGKVLVCVPVGIEPGGLAVSRDGKTVVDVSESTSMAHFIDTQSWKVVANVLVDTRPRIVEYTPDQRQIWVTSEVGGTVSIIDAASHKIIHTIGFEIAGMRPELITPVGVRFTSDGRTAFVALGRANHVAVIVTANYAVKRSLLVGQRVWQLALSADGNRLYAVNGLTNDISVIDVPNLKALITVPVERLPWGVAVKP